MKYGFDVAYNIPDLIAWSQNVRDRNDKRAEQRKQAYMQLMQMLGRGVGAYKMGKDYRDWKADQAMWNDELGMLDDISTGYYDPNDIDIDSVLEQERLITNRDDWRNQYGNSHRYGVDDLETLESLGLV